MSSHPVAGLPPLRAEIRPPADPEICSLCPKLCRFACPVATATGDEGATPTAMAQSWREAQAGRLSWDAAAENLAKCTGCEACRPPCEFGQDVPAFLVQARRDAFEHGALPPAAREAHTRLLEHDNPFGRSGETQGLSGDTNKRGRVLYWPGCRALHHWPERLHQEMDLLRALGADHVSLPARKDVPGCCGGAARVLGDSPGFQVAAAGLDQYFNRQRTWVTASSLCLRTVQDGWPETGHQVRAEILHMAEYLVFFRKRLEELGRAAAEIQPWPMIVVHDACGLHRRSGRGGAVHEVIEIVTGRRPAGFGPSPDRTICCGAGDLLDLRLPETARVTGEFAVSQRSLPPNAILVTGDTDCVESLRASLPGRQVHDLLGLLVSRLLPVAGPAQAPKGTRASDGR